VTKPGILTVVRPAEGGIRAHVLNLVSSLKEQFLFTVACPPERAAEFREAGCEVIPLSISGKLQPYQDISTMRRIYSLLRKGEFTLVHAHGFKAALLARPAARWGKVPCLVTVHGDLAHAGTSVLAKAFRGAERYFTPWATGYVTVSEWLAEMLVSDFGVSEDKITVIPNGIDLAAKQRMTEDLLPFGSNTVLVGTVARLAPRKGIDCFIRAAVKIKAAVPHARFVVVGDGPLRPELERLCRELQIDESVFFTGFRKDVPALLKRFHVFVQPSHSEGQGMTVLEAMAAGCPVVASDAGGLRELVHDGKTGLLVPSGHVAGFADAVVRLLRDGLLSQRIVAQAKEDVKAYGIKKMISDTREVYTKVLEGSWPE
jgi:glycosyltransferase involved in cell wall biosynthesis